MYASAELPMPTEPDFSEIYRDYHRRVLNLCSYLLHSRDAAEDAAHEVFLRVQRKMGTYDPTYSLANWILKIASNHCVDILRRRKTERSLFGIDVAELSNPPVGSNSPLREVLSSEQNRNVRKALMSLPEKYRVPLVLAFYNEFSYEEIAAAMKIPRNTVATLLFRGKQLLRDKLRKEKHDEVSE